MFVPWSSQEAEKTVCRRDGYIFIIDYSCIFGTMISHFLTHLGIDKWSKCLREHDLIFKTSRDPSVVAYTYHPSILETEAGGS